MINRLWVWWRLRAAKKWARKRQAERVLPMSESVWNLPEPPSTGTDAEVYRDGKPTGVRVTFGAATPIEHGRLLANWRDDLIAGGADPDDLEIPHA